MRSSIPGVITALLVGAFPAQAQTTPEELADMLVAAIAAQDSAMIVRHIHPGAASFAGQSRVSQTVRSLLGKAELGRADADIQVRVVEVADVRGYDAEQRAYRLGPLRLEFAATAPPAHFLHVDRMEARSGGQIVRVTGFAEAILEHNGIWYLTVARVAK